MPVRSRGHEENLVRRDTLQLEGHTDYRDTPYSGGEAVSDGMLLMDYYRTVLRHRRLIAALAFGGALVMTLAHLTTLPIYRSRMSLDIQSLNADFMNLRSVDPVSGPSSAETNVQTQIKLLQSESLRERVNQRLAREPHPASIDRNDLLSRLSRGMHLGHAPAIPFQTLLDETAKSVMVKPLGMTRLVEVTCGSWDPGFAAHYCDSLVNEFQSEDLENRGSEAKHTSDWLMHQASDVRQKSEETERRLFAATGGNGLILSQQTGSVGEDRLRQLQAELVKAQADRMEKEAQTVVARNSSAASTPSVVTDPSYAASRAKLAELQIQIAALVPPLTEENPKVIHIRSQIRQLQEAMSTQSNDSAQRLRNELSAAKHREDLLALSYRAQEQVVSSDLEKGSQVALLRRELESEQQLYQTLLQRAKEAGFASAMHASTIRVVDEAVRPKFASYPQRFTMGLVGFVAGLGAGLAAAFLKDRNMKLVRVPGESARLLNLEELGVIPSPSNTQSWYRSPSKILKWQATKPTGRLSLPAPKDEKPIGAAAWSDPFSLVAEAYRNATLSIMLSGDDSPSRVYVITSPQTNEGKSTVTTNLGIALSKAKMRVVVVDGDLRKPALHRALSTPNSTGLRNVLRGEVDLEKPSLSELCTETAFPGLSVISAGSGREDVVDLLHSPQLAVLLKRLREEFDIVLVDTPPLLHMVDARIFAKAADGAILILRSGITTRELAASARDLLDHDRIRIIGTVLNDFNAAKQGHSGYYKSYYSYCGQSEPENMVARP